MQRAESSLTDAKADAAKGEYDSAITKFAAGIKHTGDPYVPSREAAQLKTELEAGLEAVRANRAAGVAHLAEAEALMAVGKRHAASEDFEAACKSYSAAADKANDAKSLGRDVAAQAISFESEAKRRIVDQLRAQNRAISQIQHDGMYAPRPTTTGVTLVVTFAVAAPARSNGGNSYTNCCS